MVDCLTHNQINNKQNTKKSYPHTLHRQGTWNFSQPPVLELMRTLPQLSWMCRPRGGPTDGQPWLVQLWWFLSSWASSDFILWSIKQTWENTKWPVVSTENVGTEWLSAAWPIERYPVHHRKMLYNIDAFSTVVWKPASDCWHSNLTSFDHSFLSGLERSLAKTLISSGYIYIYGKSNQS